MTEEILSLLFTHVSLVLECGMTHSWFLIFVLFSYLKITAWERIIGPICQLIWFGEKNNGRQGYKVWLLKILSNLKCQISAFVIDLRFLVGKNKSLIWNVGGILRKTGANGPTFQNVVFHGKASLSFKISFCLSQEKWSNSVHAFSYPKPKCIIKLGDI